MGLLFAALIGVPWVLLIGVPFFLLGVGLLIPFLLVFIPSFQRLGAARVKRVLVADDDPVSILPLLDVLYSEDLEIVYAESGQEAVEELKSKSYDLVFLDLSMPDMSGIQVLFESENTEIGFGYRRYKSMPVIFYTSNRNLANAVYEMDFRKFDVRDVWDKSTPQGAVGKMVRRQLAVLG